jgi:hypothetical protein
MTAEATMVVKAIQRNAYGSASVGWVPVGLLKGVLQ